MPYISSKIKRHHEEFLNGLTELQTLVQSDATIPTKDVPESDELITVSTSEEQLQADIEKDNQNIKLL